MALKKIPEWMQGFTTIKEQKRGEKRPVIARKKSIVGKKRITK